MSIEGDRYNSGLFSPGDSISASQLNDLGALGSRGNQYYSNGSLVTQGTFGTIDLNAPQTVSAQIYDYPFKVSVGPGASAGQWKVYVRAGTVNSWIPKVKDGPMAGKYLDDQPAPYLEMNSASGNSKYVVLHCKNSSGTKFFPHETDVFLADSLESLTDTNDDGYLLLASLSLKKTGGTISEVTYVNQYIYSAQSLVRVKPGSEAAIWIWTSR